MKNLTIEVLFMKMRIEIDTMVDEMVVKVAANDLDEWINQYNIYDLKENEEGELCNEDGETLEGIDYDKFDMMGFLLECYFKDNSFRE